MAVVQSDADGALRILILEDHPADAELCESELRKAGLNFVSRRSATLSAFENELAHFSPDLILADFSLPGGFDGLAALEIASSRLPGVPFVFVSGTIGEERAVQAMKNGAADYVLKDRMARLGPAVLHALEHSRTRKQRDLAENVLRDSEGQYRDLINQAADGIFVSDREGTILLANSRYCEMLGYGANELVGLNIAQTYPVAERASLHARLAQLAEVKARVFERAMLRKDGSSFPAEISIKYLANGTHQGIVRDVTERKQQEQKIERLSRIRSLSVGINAALARSSDTQQLFDAACRLAVEHGKFGLAWIGVFDPVALEVTPAAWSGLGSDEMKQSKATARGDLPQGQGVLGRAIRESRPVFDNDISIDTGVGGKRRQEALRLGYRSLIVLPLFSENAVAGILALFAKESDFFNNEEVELLSQLASNISFALEHLARQKKIEKLSRIRAISSGINAATTRVRDRQELLDATCNIAADQGRLPLAWIGMLDPATQDLKRAAMAGTVPEYAKLLAPSIRSDTPAGQGTNGRAFREQKPVVDNDMSVDPTKGFMRAEGLRRGIRAALSLPLVVDGSAVGVMGLYAREKDYFDAEEISLLTEVARNVSFALEHMRGQEKLEKLSRIRAISSGINAAIVRTRERHDLLKEAGRIASEQGKFEMVWIGAIDHEKQDVSAVAWTGFSEETAHAVTWASIRNSKGTLGEAIHSRRPSVRNDIETELPGGKLREEALKQGCRSTVCLPLVVDDRVTALVVLFATGQGFFDKDELALLDEVASDISFGLQTIEKQEKLDYLSYYDPLTGLPNRSLFIDRTGQQTRSRGGEPLMVALILLNIERFRNINETFGRHGGDELLKLVARRLEQCFGGKDYLARIGADGFGLVIRGIRDAAAVVHAVENQALDCFREPFRLNGEELRVAAKAGIAMFPADGGDADTLFKNAEAALKNTRGSSERYLFYAADMNARAAHALSLETRLRTAVEAHQFVLHYQPKIDLAKDTICGLEALIRWRDPGGELVSPAAFIPLLEETGLILEVGKWALGRALVDHSEWTARGCKVPRIAVNVSAIQLQQKDFSDMVINVVQEQGGRPDALELEVTESLLMKDVEGSMRKLSLLRGLGVHIAMDDFGTGYSSLSYIARLPINSIKIDRSFISGMTLSPQDMAIVTTIIALAHSLNLRVVAEGVETDSQAKLLKLLKCDEAQGYLFSKPRPGPEIEPMLRKLAP